MWVQAPSRSWLVYIFPSDDLVDNPVENVEDEESHGEANPRDLVYFLGSLEEKLAHLIGGFGRGRCWVGGIVVVGSFD